MLGAGDEVICFLPEVAGTAMPLMFSLLEVTGASVPCQLHLLGTQFRG